MRIAARSVQADEAAGAVGASVTLVVRPERGNLEPGAQGALRGTIEQVVYEGGDTTYYVALEAGDRFRYCEQNRSGAKPRLQAGDAVSAIIPPGAIRVLAG